MTDGGMDERQLLAERERGHQVKQILDNRHFQDAVEAVKDRLWQEFCLSKLDDEDMRYRVRLQLDLLSSLLRALRHHIETGEMAHTSLARSQNPGQPWPKQGGQK
jgi:hypothetical protein